LKDVATGKIVLLTARRYSYDAPPTRRYVGILLATRNSSEVYASG